MSIVNVKTMKPMQEQPILRLRLVKKVGKVKFHNSQARVTFSVKVDSH